MISERGLQFRITLAYVCHHINGQSRSTFLIGMTLIQLKGDKHLTQLLTMMMTLQLPLLVMLRCLSVEPIASGAIGCDADLGGDGDNTVLYRDDNTVVKSVGNCVNNCVADNHGDQ